MRSRSSIICCTITLAPEGVFPRVGRGSDTWRHKIAACRSPVHDRDFLRVVLGMRHMEMKGAFFFHYPTRWLWPAPKIAVIRYIVSVNLFPRCRKKSLGCTLYRHGFQVQGPCLAAASLLPRFIFPSHDRCITGTI